MHTHQALEGRVQVLKPVGHILGGPETDEFVNTARELAEKGNTALLVDLADVEYMNSLGLGALTRVLITFSRVNGAVKVCCLTPRVRRLFDIVKFYHLFEYYDSERAGVDAFSKETTHPV
jgi:anti-anti-sigma factor